MFAVFYPVHLHFELVCIVLSYLQISRHSLLLFTTDCSSLRGVISEAWPANEATGRYSWMSCSFIWHLTDFLLSVHVCVWAVYWVLTGGKVVFLHHLHCSFLCKVIIPHLSLSLTQQTFAHKYTYGMTHLYPLTFHGCPTLAPSFIELSCNILLPGQHIHYAHIPVSSLQNGRVIAVVGCDSSLFERAASISFDKVSNWVTGPKMMSSNSLFSLLKPNHIKIRWLNGENSSFGISADELLEGFIMKISVEDCGPNPVSTSSSAKRLLSTSYLMSDLTSVWRLSSLSLHTYWYCIDPMTCSKPVITSSVTLASLCWILHGHIDLVTSSLFIGMRGKAAKWKHTHVWKVEVMRDVKGHQVGETVCWRLLVSLLET